MVISRRPDAVTHAQFWAEDGYVYYTNVYNHGLLRSLLVPQAGYLQEFSVGAARLGLLVPLARAPLVTNLLAIAVQALPAALLLSRRAAAFAPDWRARLILAGLYLAIPDMRELDATALNAQWHLAFAALIVLLLAPPTSRRAAVLDGAILLACGLSGPFCIVLAPLAWLLRRQRSDGAPVWRIALLGGGAALQVLCLLVVSHHLPAGFVGGPRLHSALGATPARFARLIGAKVIAAPLIGQSRALSQSTTRLWIVTIVGIAAAAWIVRHAGVELRAFLLYAAVLLAATLVSPQLQPPGWLSLTSPAVNRYFLIPQLAVLAAVAWSACSAPSMAVRGAGWLLLLVAAAIAMPSGWSYSPFTDEGFAHEAAAFDRAARGTVWHFSLNPPPWYMSLRKH